MTTELGPQSPTQAHRYDNLFAVTSYRIAILLPGTEQDAVFCTLKQVDWDNAPPYEAISYAWGDVEDKVPVYCGHGTVQVTRNLHAALSHLRYEDKPRVIWADALCINQGDLPERGAQVRQMRRIYEAAQNVLIWLGADNDANYASVAFDAIHKITEFLCKEMKISYNDLQAQKNIYPDLTFPHRNTLPSPDQCEFITETMWDSLRWIFSNHYFTRVWVIQEVNASKNRIVHCGTYSIDWVPVEFVAGYIILDKAFSKAHGFTDKYCWWASTTPTELLQGVGWLHMLYLASNYSASDPRDVVYGLRGIMKFRKGAEILDPDYKKTTVEVYRDTVEASLVNFEKTDALLYVHGVEDPSWIPRWDKSMLFRNPFRFGKPVPWTPAGDSKPMWTIDKAKNSISLSSIMIDSIKVQETYRDYMFGDSTRETELGIAQLRTVLVKVLGTLAMAFPPLPLGRDPLTKAAVSFSFGCNDLCQPTSDEALLNNFLAFLKLTLGNNVYEKYISRDLDDAAQEGRGQAFGKPVWDFEYPPSSFFITEKNIVGCCMAPTKPGDWVSVPMGSSYPLVLRPDGELFSLRGFCFVHGIMKGEAIDFPTRDVEIV